MNIKLQNQLGIQVVSDLKIELEKALASGEAVVLDSSEVESAALQLLASFVQYAAIKKCEIQWQEPTPAFLDTVKLMGLSAVLHV